MSEKENRENLLAIMSENPDLPIFAVMSGKWAGTDNESQIGLLGNCGIREYLIGSDRIYFRDDEDENEIERVVTEKRGVLYYLSISRGQAAEDYAAMPWGKAIVVKIEQKEKALRVNE
jgi:hypothetical protein